MIRIGLFGVAAVGIYARCSPSWAIPAQFPADRGMAFSEAWRSRWAVVNTLGNLGGLLRPDTIGWPRDAKLGRPVGIPIPRGEADPGLPTYHLRGPLYPGLSWCRWPTGGTVETLTGALGGGG